jgi:hypothetical protein
LLHLFITLALTRFLALARFFRRWRLVAKQM